MFRSEEGSILSKLNGAEYANTKMTEVKLTMRNSLGQFVKVRAGNVIMTAQRATVVVGKIPMST